MVFSLPCKLFFVPLYYRGEVGASITLTIVRGTENPFDLEIKRDIIKVQSVKHRFINNVGVLRISTFNEQTTTGLKKIIEDLFLIDLKKEPLKRFVRSRRLFNSS